MRLYRHGLKQILYYAIRRELWWEEGLKLRGEFEQNAHVKDTLQVERLLQKGEQRLKEKLHPDPIIVPYYPGGSLFQRNPPMPKMQQHLDFGREGYH